MKSRAQIKKLAKQALSQRRGSAILLVLVFTLTCVTLAALDLHFLLTSYSGAVGHWFVSIAALLVISVMLVNMNGEFIKVYKQQPVGAEAAFTGFRERFWRKLGGMAWMALWVFLWMQLLIVPGIIRGLAYFCTPYILADCPKVPATQALRTSVDITHGHKFKIFVFFLSFIGWGLLPVLPFLILSAILILNTVGWLVGCSACGRHLLCSPSRPVLLHRCRRALPGAAGQCPGRRQNHPPGVGVARTRAA